MKYLPSLFGGVCGGILGMVVLQLIPGEQGALAFWLGFALGGWGYLLGMNR